jgi:hypothetical protein
MLHCSEILEQNAGKSVYTITMRKKAAVIPIVVAVMIGALWGCRRVQGSPRKEPGPGITFTVTPTAVQYSNPYPPIYSQSMPYPGPRELPALPNYNLYPPPPTAMPTSRPIPTLMPPVVPAGYPTPASINRYMISSIYFINSLQGWLFGHQDITISSKEVYPIYHTQDGGRTWLPWSKFMLARDEKDASYPSDIHIFDEKNGLIFGNDVYITHDSGQTWQTYGYPGLRWSGNGWIGRGVTFLDQQGDSIWALERNCPEENQCKTTLVESISSSNWEPEPLTLPVTQTQAGLIHRGNADTAWLVDGPYYSEKPQPHDLFITRDGGRNWQALPGISIGNCGPSRLASAGDRVWLLCTFPPATVMMEKKLYLSEDGGLTWSLKSSTFQENRIGNLPLIGTPIQFVAVGENTLFFSLARGGMSGSFDGGQEWLNALGYDPGAFGDIQSVQAIFFIDSIHGWAATNNLVFRTEDGGRSWETTTITLPFIPQP